MIIWITSIALGFMPWALIMLPIHEHYNWKTPRNKKLVDRILLAMRIITFIQAGFALFSIYLTLHNLHFINW